MLENNVFPTPWRRTHVWFDVPDYTAEVDYFAERREGPTMFPCAMGQQWMLEYYDNLGWTNAKEKSWVNVYTYSNRIYADTELPNPGMFTVKMQPDTYKLTKLHRAPNEGREEANTENKQSGPIVWMTPPTGSEATRIFIDIVESMASIPILPFVWSALTGASNPLSRALKPFQETMMGRVADVPNINDLTMFTIAVVWDAPKTLPPNQYFEFRFLGFRDKTLKVKYGGKTYISTGLYILGYSAGYLGLYEILATEDAPRDFRLISHAHSNVKFDTSRPGFTGVILQVMIKPYFNVKGAKSSRHIVISTPMAAKRYLRSHPTRKPWRLIATSEIPERFEELQKNDPDEIAIDYMVPEYAVDEYHVTLGPPWFLPGLYVPTAFSGGFWMEEDTHVPYAEAVDAPITIGKPELGFLPTIDLYLYVDASIPAGCSLVPTIIDETGTEHETAEDSGDGIYHFVLPPNRRTIRVKWTFIASKDRKHAPVLRAYTVQRDGLITLVNHGDPWEPIKYRDGTAKMHRNALEDIKIESPEREIWRGNASFRIHDVENTLDRLDRRGCFSVKIETEYDPNDRSKRCVLFRGYADEITKVRRGRGMFPQLEGVWDPSKGFPHPYWPSFNVKCTNMWKRLEETYFEHRFYPLNVLIKTENGMQIGQKVTDIIVFLLKMAGFPDDMIAIDDLPVTFYPIDEQKFESFLNPLDSVSKFLKEVCRNYLNRFLWFDENYGPDGKWILIAPATAPYEPKAYFTLKHPTTFHNDGIPRVPQKMESYGMFTTASGKQIPIVPIRPGTIQSRVIPPEVNEITVSSVTSLLGTRENVRHTLTLNNPISYDFYPGHHTSDPNHPDYLGRRVSGWVFDPYFATHAISSEDGQPNPMLYSYAKRLFDMACLAVKQTVFTAPLVLIPHEKEPGRVRPLRFYDPVSIDGQDWIVRSVNIAYSKDFDQIAVYELEAPRF